MTDKYPDVVHLMQRIQRERASELRDMILDTELAAVDRAQNNKLLAFQALSTRGRYGLFRSRVRVKGKGWLARGDLPFEDVMPCSEAALPSL